MASSIVTSSLRPLAMSESSSSTILSHPSVSTISSSKTRCSLLATRTSLPLSFSRFSLSLKTQTHLKKSPFVTSVAETSDWSQQDGEEADGSSSSVAVEESDPEPEATFSEGEGDVSEGGDFTEPLEEAKLFVGNLAYDVDSQALAMLFEQAGTVEIAELKRKCLLILTCSFGFFWLKVIYNRETDQSRGFGFVTMSTVEEAETAVEKFNRYVSSYVYQIISELLACIDGLEGCCSFDIGSLVALSVLNPTKDLNGRLLTVNKAAPRGSRPERQPRVYEPAFRVYVGNLPWDVDNGRLEQVFSEHGKVVEARVVYDRETGRSRGFGFVTMSNETELNDAIAALDGQNMEGRAIRVNVAEERPRLGGF
ncbi:hypothetical protein YC2023_087417 [Brassica napus]